MLNTARDTVRAISQVTAEYLIGAFSAKSDGRARLTESGEKPDGQSSGIRAWLIRVVREVLDRAFQILLRAQVQLFVICPVMFNYLLDIFRLVKAATVKSDREGPDARLGCLGGVVQDRR